MTFYVERSHPDGRAGWTGPIRSLAQAWKEAGAWHDAGWSAIVHESSPEIKAKVRAWSAQFRPKARRLR